MAAELLRTRGQIPRRDANLAAGLAVGGFYGLVAGRTPRAGLTGTLTGGLTVLLGTVGLDLVRSWGARRALKVQEKQEKQAQGIRENQVTKWVPELPKWSPLKVRDVTLPNEVSEAELVCALTRCFWCFA